MTSPLLLSALQDLMQVSLVVVCVFAGWSLQQSACSVFIQKLARPQPKIMGKIIVDQETDDEVDTKEVVCQDDDVPKELRIFEQYGLFGAPPGAWTTRVAREGFHAA
eukprot:TRINITY_DN72316_c0_g1_i1.p2 TRINITY_DN72316_c0_g1~~TRINITY_DN72316_c0_g1_i1.p2  ORF type:complete len:107 (+),score=25.12 TRINITY_DN72316_c0_g1_i1:120-440(+)